MAIDLEQVYERLFAYCKAENFAGYDPFDGLNSRLFQMTPLKYSRLARLAWLQMIKRVAYNLRPALRVEKGVNPKGLALFALAELSRFRRVFSRSLCENARVRRVRIVPDLWDLRLYRPVERAEGYARRALPFAAKRAVQAASVSAVSSETGGC